MQLRNGKSTARQNIIRCTPQKASLIIPTKSCLSNDSDDSPFYVGKLSEMIKDFNIRYEGPHQRSNRLCEIYDYMNQHIEAIRELKGGVVLNIMRKHTIKLVEESTNTAIIYGKNPDILNAILKLTTKMLLVLAKMGPE